MARAARIGRKTSSARADEKGPPKRVTLPGVNAQLKRRGYPARLEKGGGYFVFSGGEADNWLNRTVARQRISDLSLDQWLQEFENLRKQNRDMLKTPRRK